MAGRIDMDHALEEVAEQHRHQGHGADDHGRNRQQHQRQPDHPGRFVRLLVVAMPVAVIVMMRVRVLVIALLPVEHQEVQAERIEGRHEHAGQHGKVGEARSGKSARVHRFDDGVLGVKTREERRADQRQIAQQEGDPGNGHVFAHTAHPADILVVVHAHNDRAGPQEQQRFKEGVRHQVEHRHRVGRCTQRHRHVAQLRQRGIGHHALDVVLDDRQKAHEQRRDRPDDQDEVERSVGQLEQRRHALHHEDAGCHHGGSVDQRGNRGGAFHRVRQPSMQRKLGRFTHGTNEQADARHRQEQPACAG